MSFFVVEQLPVLKPEALMAEVRWLGGAVCDWLAARVVELSYTSVELESFARDVGIQCPPFRWEPERRVLLQAEIDAAVLHCYQLTRGQAEWLLDSFTVLRKYEESDYGDYRTKRVILEIYDAMQDAIRMGQPYRTRLDPPPGPPRDADGNFLSYAQIASSPPPHIHLPRGAAVGEDVALQMTDLASRFPTVAFMLRLGTSGNAKVLRVRPVRTPKIQASDRVVLASANLRNAGSSVPAAIGKLRVEARTDASDGSAYVLVTVRGDDGTAQARFSDEEWRGLTTIGVVDDGDGS